MRLGYDLTTEQSQRLIMSPVLLQSLRILAMTAEDLGEFAGEAMLANPVLEEASPYKEGLQAYLQEYYAANGRGLQQGAGHAAQRNDTLFQAGQDADEKTDLSEMLRRQLGLTRADNMIRNLCEYLIDSLDDSGYLTVTVDETVALGKGAFSAAQVEEALGLLQSFDPAGVGARSAGECLCLQLARRGELDDCYRRLLDEDLELLARNRIRELADKYGLGPAQMQQRADVIRGLSPAPGSALSQREETVYLLPDVLLEKTEDGYKAIVNERIIPSLRVSAYYESLMKEGAADAKTQQYLKERVESAVRLLSAIAQRKETIRKVAQSIADHQAAFLGGSVKDLKPLTMRQVAEETGLHISTVSRTVRGKYMECPCGLLELRSFFSGRLGTAADGVSAKSARAVLAEILKEEDSRRPLSDETIAGMMQERGIAISRRTVAKYRGQLGIPGSSKRKRF